MSTTFATHTANLRALIASSRFVIPEFQRRYSWRVEHELADLWNDLVAHPKNESYFMGIIIVTQSEDGRLSVVDGQQRLITLSLFANAIRILAKREKKSLIERSLRDSILFATDFEAETEVPSLELSHESDRRVFNSLIKDGEMNENDKESLIYEAHVYLTGKLEKALKEDGTSALSLWASFLTEKLYMSAFINQTADAAYKVFEAVNARGKSLTPSEMIKAYVIGSMMSEKSRSEIYARWTAIERRFEEAHAESQLTQFVRHSLTLRHGYVLPRDLYRVVTDRYKDDQVMDLVGFLEGNLDLYLSLVEPDTGIGNNSENFTRLSTILELLGITTVRPIVMAASQAGNSDKILEELVSIIVPRMVVGTFGTGAIEARFAKAAQSLYIDKDWDQVFTDLRSLIPEKEFFEEKVATRKLNRAILCLLRFSVIQNSRLPEIDGFLHYIRQSRVTSWPGFSDEEFDVIGRTIGNSILLDTETRPYGTTTPQETANQFEHVLSDGELLSSDEILGWTAEDAGRNGRIIARKMVGIWYA